MGGGGGGDWGLVVGGGGGGGGLKNTHGLSNLKILKFQNLNKMHIFQCRGKIYFVWNFKYLTYALKDIIFYVILKFEGLLYSSIFEKPSGTAALTCISKQSRCHVMTVGCDSNGLLRRYCDN